MPLYSFVCICCNEPFQSPAQNAKFCQKRACQKQRKDINRKPKPKSAKPPEDAKHEDILPETPPPNTQPKKDRQTPRKDTKQKPRLNEIIPNELTEVEHVNDHIIVFRTKNPKYEYIPDALKSINQKIEEQRPDDISPDEEDTDEDI